MDRATALIISDDPEFCVWSDRWRENGRHSPDETDLCAIWMLTASISPLWGRYARASAVSIQLSIRRASRWCLSQEQAIRRRGATVRVLQQQEGWLDALVLVSTEILRLGQALARAHRAEHAKKSLEQQATLGRYMLDVRHTLNNSLTSVLGNSELLVLDPGSLSAAERSQIETIRNMAVRMHEILRRFSSIEKELNAVEKQAENEARTKSRAASASF